MKKGTRIAASLAGGAIVGGLAFGALHSAQEQGRDTGAQHYEAEVIDDAGPYALFALEALMINAGIKEEDRRREAGSGEPTVPPSLRIVPHPNSDHPPA